MSFWLTASRTLAYPPAPSHVIYGLVRDEYGTPLMTSSARIILQTPSGAQLQAAIIPGLGLGVNYRLDVPMDAGLTADLYQPNALTTSARFRMFVVVGQTTNLPIQMTGDFSRLGRPSQFTRIDLTLGTDANGDGLPDAWEQAFLAALGSNLTLADLQPGMDLAHDGRTLLQEFLAGSYPFDPGNTFVVKLVALNDSAPVLEFTTMTGRYYTILGSPDLARWTPLAFRVPGEGAAGPVYSYCFASSIQDLQVQVIQPGSGPAMRFFRVVLQ